MPYLFPDGWLLSVGAAPVLHEGGLGPDELIRIIAIGVAVLGLLGLGYWLIRNRPWEE